jgi:hypothetical protein
METKRLESKMWFRFLKVFFIFTEIFCFLAILGIAYMSRPNEDNLNIFCEDGKKYISGEYAIGKDGKGADLLCITGKTDIGDGLTTEQLNRLLDSTHVYNIEPANKYTATWQSFSMVFLLSLLATTAFFEIVKRAFYYIVSGEKPFRLPKN